MPKHLTIPANVQVSTKFEGVTFKNILITELR
jgi:hypothetical protein